MYFTRDTDNGTENVLLDISDDARTFTITRYAGGVFTTRSEHPLGDLFTVADNLADDDFVGRVGSPELRLDVQTRLRAVAVGGTVIAENLDTGPGAKPLHVQAGAVLTDRGYLRISDWRRESGTSDLVGVAIRYWPDGPVDYDTYLAVRAAFADAIDAIMVAIDAVDRTHPRQRTLLAGVAVRLFTHLQDPRMAPRLRTAYDDSLELPHQISSAVGRLRAGYNRLDLDLPGAVTMFELIPEQLDTAATPA